jgi:Fe-S-cluster containining protein
MLWCMSACDGCAADCCRRFDVVVSGWDVYRLGRDLRLPLDRFIVLDAADAPDQSHQIVLDTAATTHRYHRLQLAKRDGACTFLVDAGGIGRCGVYASRPAACRAYPAASSSEPLQLTRREHCPPGAWDDIDAALYRGHYEFGQRQREIFDVVTDGWNERVLVRRESRTPAELFAWLAETYAALERKAPSWFDDTPVAMTEEEVRSLVGETLRASGWL